MNVCQKTKINLNDTFYQNELNIPKINKKWSNKYSIPVKLTKNLFSSPISFKFETTNDMIKYMQQHCKQYSKIFVDENPFVHRIFGWKISFLYEKTTIKYCKLNKKYKIECTNLKTVLQLINFFPINIKCKKLPNEFHNKIYPISKLTCKFSKVFFFFIIFCYFRYTNPNLFIEIAEFLYCSL